MANKIKDIEPVDGLAYAAGTAPIESIRVNGNQRTVFDPAKMRELVESVRRQGVINPITVRESIPAEDPAMPFVLVAGARRLRAAKEAGLPEVPIRRILNATPELCEQIQAIENLQRVDLTPVEEARCYRSLVSTLGRETGAYSDVPAEVAIRVGKSIAHVNRSIALLALDEKILSMIDAGAMPVRIAHQILRVPEKYRETLAKFATTKGEWSGRYPTLEEVETQIERTVERDLKHAWFPKDVENYGGDDMPTCAACPFNTGNQSTLFEGARDGSCTNPGCFAKRTSSYLKQLKAQGAERWPDLKFVGTATANHGDDHQIAGRGVVDHKSAKIKKLLEEKPAAFGYGILKPRAYDKTGKPRLAVVLLEAEALPKKERPKVEERANQDPLAQARDAYAGEQVSSALALLAAKKLRKRSKELLVDLVDDVGLRYSVYEVFGIARDMKEKEIRAIVAKMDASDLILLLWFEKFSSGYFAHSLEKKGIATKATISAAEKKAAIEFEKRNALRCAKCGCSADVACKLKKPGGESWEMIPCSWHDPASPTPTCTAHPKPKEKTDAKNK